MLEDGDDVDVCFMDFKEAFDLVNHRLLLEKLRALGFGEDCIAWVRAFLGNREFRVRVEGEISEWATAPSGEPQTSVLGPYSLHGVHQRPSRRNAQTFFPVCGRPQDRKQIIKVEVSLE